MMPRFWNPFLVVLLSVVLCGTAYGTAYAENGEVQQGKRLYPVSATAATGRWLERAAFEPSTYGKVRGVSPSASKEAKVVLYTNVLSDDFFKIAVAVDNYIAGKPELAWSFVQVEEAHGAQAGGYTESELRARIAEIKTLVEKHGIKHLSFVISAGGGAMPTPEVSVVLAHVRLPRPADGPAGKMGSFPIVDWVIKKSASDLQGDNLGKQIAALDAVIYPKP